MRMHMLMFMRMFAFGTMLMSVGMDVGVLMLVLPGYARCMGMLMQL